METMQGKRVALTRRSFLGVAACAAATAALGGLAGCSSGEGAAGGGASGGGAASGEGAPALTAQPEERDLKGSPDACDVRVGLIMGPPSMGLSQFIVAANANKTFNRFSFTVNSVDYVGLSAMFNQGDFDICTLPSNIGPILYNNDELKNDYQVVSVNNLGVLYVMTNGESVQIGRAHV